ncbi:MAG: archaetidylinositol phosphate synthase [Candidatus Bathyarchaeota archaeon]|nr:archaetidylinositol phosphate synthase [Candidatus Bathyarchaeota archaeon]MDH5787248.1 archaetidylinositol phosphate synthase [Candidatus Bathyarchaeota archaeon]
MITKLKQKIQQTLTIPAKTAHKIGLTPNKITAIGIALAFLSALAFTQWQNHRFYLLLAAALLLLSGFCDALDGVIARLYQQTTAFGSFLDSLLDRYADAVIYATIISAGLCEPQWGLAALIGSIVVSYSRAKAEADNIKMESVGIAERAERIIILSITTITAIYWLSALNIGIIILAILSNLTVLQRSLHVYKILKKTEIKEKH